MKIPKEGQMLRIYIGENNKYKSTPLYEWIVLKAREHGLAGATVLRGIMGYGANSRIHTTKILRLSEDMPVIVEIVDTKEKLKDFLEIIDETISEGLATIQNINVQLYRSSKKPEAE